jgi:hypothetical protein
MISYFVSLIVIIVILVSVVFINRSRSSGNIDIQFEVMRGPILLDTGTQTGYIKTPADSPLLWDSSNPGCITFTFEALNRVNKESRLIQSVVDIDNLAIKETRDFLPAETLESSGGMKPIWCENPFGYNIYFFTRFRFPRGIYDGDFLWTSENYFPNQKSTVIAMDTLGKYITSSRIRPSDIILTGDDLEYLSILGELWHKPGESSVINLSMETGYAVLVQDAASVMNPGSCYSSVVFELPDKFSFNMNATWLPNHQAAVIAHNIDDPAGNILVYRSNPVKVQDRIYAGFENVQPRIIREAKANRDFDSCVIFTDPRDSTIVCTSWIEKESGYDLEKAKRDILKGLPGRDFFRQSMYIRISRDGCITFNDPINITENDILIDGTVSFGYDGNIHTCYSCISQDRLQTKFKTLDLKTNQITTRFIFNTLNCPDGVPIKPDFLLLKGDDGIERLIVISKLNDEQFDANFYGYSLSGRNPTF